MVLGFLVRVNKWTTISSFVYDKPAQNKRNSSGGFGPKNVRNLYYVTCETVSLFLQENILCP